MKSSYSVFFRAFRGEISPPQENNFCLFWMFFTFSLPINYISRKNLVYLVDENRLPLAELLTGDTAVSIAAESCVSLHHQQKL